MITVRLLSSTNEQQNDEPDAVSPSSFAVHFANSASLIEKLTLAKVRRFQMRVYTDSNHGMNKVRFSSTFARLSIRFVSLTRRELPSFPPFQYGAYRELHEAMTAFLLEKWGVGGKRRGWSA